MLFLLPSPKPSALLEVRGPNPGDRVARRPHSCGRRIQCGTSCRRPVLASLGGLGKDVRGQEWVPGKRMGRAEEPCLHSPMSLPVLYPLYKCAEIKRNASEKRELQGNRELAARPSGSAVIAKCQSAVCQHPPPPPPSEAFTEAGGGTPSRACYRDRQSWTSLGQTGLLSTFCFHLEIVPFPLPLGRGNPGANPWALGGFFVKAKFQLFILNHPPFLCRNWRKHLTE